MPTPAPLHTPDTIPISRVGPRWLRAAVAAVATALIVGVPADIIDTPLFSREVPVRWWEYPVYAATVLLTAAWFGIQGPRRDEQQSTAPITGVMLAVFAVGCPVCNKLVVASIGVSGALGIWAPIQPLLAAVSLILLTVAVVYRWRRRACSTSACAPAQQTLS